MKSCLYLEYDKQSILHIFVIKIPYKSNFSVASVITDQYIKNCLSEKKLFAQKLYVKLHTVEVNSVKTSLILLEFSLMYVYILILACGLYLLLHYISLSPLLPQPHDFL